MSKNENKKAQIKATGHVIEVYASKSKKDTWIDYMDCNTTYLASELTFLN